MGLDEVKQEILNNAKKQAKKIIEDAEKERDSLINNANEQIKELKNKIDEEIKITIEQYKSMVFTETSAFLKKQKLNLEKNLVDEVFENVKKNLNELQEKKRKEHLLKILDKFSSKEFNKIYCSEKDIKLLEKYSPKKENILGGIIFENNAGEVRIDFSYDSLLDEIKKEYISNVSKIVFK